MQATNAILLWSLLAFIATLFGAILLLIWKEWSRSNIWRILAFASGVLLGVAFVHIVPEANFFSPRLAGLGLLSSFLLLFGIEGFTMMHSCAEYAEDCPIHIVSWTAFGALALHCFLDGMAITIAFQKNSLLGLAVSSAILIHKMTDGLTLTGLLLGANYSTKKCLGIVTILGCVTPLGAFLFIPFAHWISNTTLGWYLGFVAGAFFYVGAADILPRIHKVRDFYCLGAFVLGLFLGAINPR